MQEGIGRGGYRWLSSVFFGFGMLGLLGTLYAFLRGEQRQDLFNGAMLVLTAAAMCVLFGLVILVLRRPQPAPEPAASPAPVAFTPSRKIEFEFPVEEPDAEPTEPVQAAVTEVRPFGQPLPTMKPKKEVRFGVPAPPVRSEPELPPNRNIGADSGSWPARKGPSGLTRGEHKERQTAIRSLPRATREQVPDDALVIPATGGTTMAIRKEPAPTRRPNAPVVLARLAFPNAPTPAGMQRGKCGTCNAALYATSQRPVNLRCPSCDTVTLLE